MTTLIEKLNDKKIFSSTEQVIADYILKNSRNVTNLSTRQLAKETFTSSAAVVRFSQKLGFEGYVDFKKKLLTEIMEQLGEIPSRFINEKDSIEDIVEKVAGIEINALKETYDKVELTLFARAANYLSQADYIDFYAMSSNLNIARMAADNFVFAGKYCTVAGSLSSQYLQAYKVPKDHIAFIISRTGENKFLTKIAEVLSDLQVPIFLLTSNAKSSIGKIAQVVFETAGTDKMEELGPRVFATGAKFIVDVLFAILMSRMDYVEAQSKFNWLDANLKY